MNVYIEPTTGTAIGIGRTQVNQAIQSVLTNFVGGQPPTSSNFTIDGLPTAPLEGMLFRSSTNKALYVADSATSKSATMGKFTRIGVGNRVETDNTALTSNAASYEVGELVMVLNATGADTRLYMCVDNSAGLPRFADVNRLQGMTLGQGGNISFGGLTTTVGTVYATSNVGVNMGATAYPTRTLDVRGDANVSTNIYLGSYIYKMNDIQGYIGFPLSNTFGVFTQNTQRVQVDPQGNVKIGTGSTKAKLEVTGNAYFSGQTRLGGGSISDQNVTLVTPRYLGFGTPSAENTKLYYDGTTTWLTALAGNINTQLIANTNWYVQSFTADKYIGFNSSTGAFSVTGTIYCTGEITAFSDERLKSDVETIDNALATVSQLRGVTYTKDDKKSIGLIAQEVEKILPEVVYQSETEFKSLAYGNIVGLLIEAIKELRTEVQDLKRRVDVTL